MFGCKMISVCVLLAVLVSEAHGKVFTRCQLVHELRRQGFPEGQMRNWVCLVESESGRDSSRVGPRNHNGSKDYGLFQINDKYWCSASSKPGKDCHVTCSDLIKDNITKASQCAKKVFARHGFRAWYGWRSKCQGTLPDISSC